MYCKFNTDTLIYHTEPCHSIQQIIYSDNSSTYHMCKQEFHNECHYHLLWRNIASIQLSTQIYTGSVYRDVWWSALSYPYRFLLNRTTVSTEQQLCLRRTVGRFCSLPLPSRKDRDGLFGQENGNEVDAWVCGATLQVRTSQSIAVTQQEGSSLLTLYNYNLLSLTVIVADIGDRVMSSY